MYLGVKEVKPIDNYKLILTFGNNEVKIFDMIPYLDKGIFQELKDENLFKAVKVSFDSIPISFYFPDKHHIFCMLQHQFHQNNY